MDWSLEDIPPLVADDQLPPVVAVLLTQDGGEERVAHEALEAQDYPLLCVVELEGAVPVPAQADAADAVASDSALGAGPGMGPGYYLFCHDGVVLAPGGVRGLVYAALTTGAGVVGPKLVRAADPRRLVEMGYAVAKSGAVASLVEPGELDQGQHDGSREVFAVPGACLLVRTDVFRATGGFDVALGPPAGDVSFCWRARVAGARVVVTSEAQASVATRRLADRGTDLRSRLRLVLSCYGRRHRLRVLPQMLAAGALASLGSLAALRPRRAAAPWMALAWNLRHAGSLRALRRQVRRSRRVGDAAVRRHQVPGLVRPRLRIRRSGQPGSAGTTGPRPVAAWADRLQSRWTGGAAVVMLALAGVQALGSRHLVSRGVPVVGDLLPFGSEGVSAGLGALRVLLTAGLIPLGIVGALTVLRPTGSPRAPASAALAYAALPMAYGALAAGRWEPLVVYAIAPWWLVQLGTLAPPGLPPRDGPRRALVLGASTALAAVLAPAAPLLLAGTGLALAIGSVLGFQLRSAARILGTTLGGTLVALALQLPWMLDPGASGSLWSTLRDLAEGRARGAPGAVTPPADLLGFAAGRPEALPWLWALPVLAALPLVIGKRSRLVGAIRVWVLALAGWAAALLTARHGLVAPLPDVDGLLVLAGVGIAAGVGLAAATVEQDIPAPGARRVRRRDRRRWRPPRQARHLGWRGAIAGVGIVLLALGSVPLVRSSLDGYWGMPRGDFASVLAFVDDDVAASGGRILWLGDPEVVPLGHVPLGGGADGDRSTGTGRRGGLSGGPALALTDRLPRLLDRWRPTAPSVLTSTRAAVESGTAQETSRLGRALAVIGVEYVVVPQGLAPSPFGVPRAPAPDLVDALDGQLDLQRVRVDPAVVVYRNLEFRPGGPAPSQRWALSPWTLGAGGAAWALTALALIALQRRRRLRREAAT